MNGYQKTLKGEGENRLFPSLSPSDDVKRDVWREYHQNKFWSSFIGEGEDSCPVCSSPEYEEAEKDIGVKNYPLKTVLVWYRCVKCSQRWVNRREVRYKYGT